MIECSELSDVINFIRYLFMTNRRWDADMEWVLLNAVMVSVVSDNLLIIWNFASSFRYQHYLNDREAVKLFLVFHFNGIRIGHCLGHFRSRNLLIYVCFYVCSSAFPLGINLSRFWHELVQFYKYDFYQLLLIEVIKKLFRLGKRGLLQVAWYTQHCPWFYNDFMWIQLYF